MKKIMYLMHVPWDWIKQRPHFIAEELSNYYDVSIFEKKSYKKRLLSKNERNNLKIFKVFKFPFERFSLVRSLNSLFFKFYFLNKTNKFDYIWISDIFIYEELRKYIKKEQKIIYDCMDDILEFESIKASSLKKNAIKKERLLIENADIIFTSSEYLKNKILNRYKVDAKKINIINNGINQKFLEKPFVSDKNKNEIKVITYIGTISSCFDFDLLLISLDKVENIEYHLYGPLEIEIPQNEKIKYKGILKHEEIIDKMNVSDILIMPFVLNELVLSVNPVKLYEYIYSRKPVVSVQYQETEKFKDFVYLYRTPEEYVCYIKKICESHINNNPNKSIDEFLLENTWKSRTDKIIKILEFNNENNSNFNKL